MFILFFVNLWINATLRYVLDSTRRPRPRAQCPQTKINYTSNNVYQHILTVYVLNNTAASI